MNDKPLSNLAFRFRQLRVTLLKERMKQSLLFPGNFKPIASISLSNSYFCFTALSMRYISVSSFNKPLKFWKLSSFILMRVATSLKFSVPSLRSAFFKSTSVCVRTKKKGLWNSPETFSAICLANAVNRVLQSIKNASYFSRPPIFLQYLLKSSFLGVPIPGKSQNLIFLYSGWGYAVGFVVASTTSTPAAPFW